MIKFPHSIKKYIGTFGVENQPIRDCVKTYTTKIFEIKKLVSILYIKIAKGGYVPSHLHNNLTILIPLKGKAAISGANPETIGYGDTYVIQNNQVHGVEKVKDSFHFLSICIGGRIVKNQNQGNEDFQIVE